MALQLQQKRDEPMKYSGGAALVSPYVGKLISRIDSSVLPISIERPSPRG